MTPKSNRVRYPWEKPEDGIAIAEIATKHEHPVALPLWATSTGFDSAVSDGERPGYREALDRLTDHTIRNSPGIAPSEARDRARKAAQRVHTKIAR